MIQLRHMKTTRKDSMDNCICCYLALRNSTKRRQIPDDIIYKIFSMAGFTYSVTTSRSDEKRGDQNQNELYWKMDIPSSLMISTFFGLCPANKAYMPLSCVFTVESHDQGWASEDLPMGNHNSCTWGEASVCTNPNTTNGDSFESNRIEVYRNLRANSNFEKQIIVYDLGTPFMNDLIAAHEYVNTENITENETENETKNDTESKTEINAISTDVLLSNSGLEIVQPYSIKLWSRSVYPGWTNTIRYASIEIKFEITEEICNFIIKNNTAECYEFLVKNNFIVGNEETEKDIKMDMKKEVKNGIYGCGIN